MSPKHAPTEIDQSLNKSRCQPSFHLFLFTLAPYLSSPFSLISLSYLLLAFFDTDTTDSPSTLPFLFSLPFFYHQPSLCVSGAWHALCLFNCHGLGRIEEDEDGMGWGGQCRERLKEWGRVEWQNLLTFLPSSLAVSPKGEDSKWVMGQFLVGTNIARALLCFNEPGSQDYIYSNRLGLRFQNVLGIHLMAFC